LKVIWATIILVIGGIFANPQSAKLKRSGCSLPQKAWEAPSPNGAANTNTSFCTLAEMHAKGRLVRNKEAEMVWGDICRNKAIRKHNAALTTPNLDANNNERIRTREQPEPSLNPTASLAEPNEC
jgi:hypothetical protein